MQKFFTQVKPQRQLQQAPKQGTDGDDSIVFKNGECGVAKTGKGFDVITIENGAFANLADWSNYDAYDILPIFEGYYDKIKFDLKPNQKLYYYKSEYAYSDLAYLVVVENGNLISGTKIVAGEAISFEKNFFDMNDRPAEVEDIGSLSDNTAMKAVIEELKEVFKKADSVEGATNGQEGSKKANHFR